VPGDSVTSKEPNWSPKGDLILFEEVLPNGAPVLQLLDMRTRSVSTVPESMGYTSPRWSPDGRYIVAMTKNASALVLFDFQTGRWSELLQGMPLGFPNWSHDGQYVYLIRFLENAAVLRIRISDKKLELIADLKGFTSTGWWGVWLGLDPDDSPLMLRDAGTQDVYSVDWKAVASAH
jgi:dipeptidyl aminopeptidase/acylaminoacyl peptidase